MSYVAPFIASTFWCACTGTDNGNRLKASSLRSNHPAYAMFCSTPRMYMLSRNTVLCQSHGSYNSYECWLCANSAHLEVENQNPSNVAERVKVQCVSA